ncbi:hypothetical protein SAMN05444401_1730 [Clostridium amylolyticum]|uniref:Phage protein n=1 Tax=Clostridium amylolyticum TaxID=1121298 RepID=A0A1M6EXH8_9CLOT|nr:hypothetical protein [Clostridium amylolyticum]SHI90071.1 hypothetical protein SAMN05444401_1730 [Clostridium amylolyticum]
MEIDIKNYIEDSIVKLKDRLFPIFTTDIKKPSVVYNFTPISGGHIKESQLELKVIWSDYDQVKEIETEINKIMDTEEDKSFIAYGNTYFKSSVGGGGLLFRDDLQMYENTLIFIIKWRCKNG